MRRNNTSVKRNPVVGAGWIELQPSPAATLGRAVQLGYYLLRTMGCLYCSFGIRCTNVLEVNGYSDPGIVSLRAHKLAYCLTENGSCEWEAEVLGY